jgi:hypothetical protein
MRLSLASLRLRLMESPNAALVADYVSIVTAAMSPKARAAAREKGTHQAFLEVGGEAQAATKVGRELDFIVEAWILKALTAADDEMVESARGLLAAQWHGENGASERRFAVLGRRALGRQHIGSRIGRAIFNRDVGWDVFKWGIAGAAAFVVGSCASQPRLTIADASLIRGWDSSITDASEVTKLQESLGALWASTMASNTLSTLPDWCEDELPTGRLSPPCGAHTLTRLAQILQREAGPKGERATIPLLKGDIAVWNPPEKASVPRARLLFEQDFVTKHLWGQPGGFVPCSGVDCDRRRERAEAAVDEYEQLVKAVQAHACQAARSLEALIKQSEEHAVCFVELSIQNQGTGDAEVGLGEVRGRLDYEPQTTKVEDASTTTGIEKLTPFGQFTLRVEVPCSEKTRPKEIVVPYRRFLLPTSATQPVSVLRLRDAPTRPNFDFACPPKP